MQCLSIKLCQRISTKFVADKYLAQMQFYIRTNVSKSTYCSTITDVKQKTILKQVSDGDKENEHKLKVLFLEVELLRQEGQLVPEEDEMDPKHYAELLKLNTRNARRKYLQFLFKLCRKNENRSRKKQEKLEELLKVKEQRTNKDLPIEEFSQIYDLQHNNIFLRFRDQTINNLYNHNLIKAMQFGQKLIVDCGFHEKMTDRENSNCSKQLMLLFGENRIHVDPFDLHFCNFDGNSLLGKTLFNRIPTLYDPEFPLNVHSQSYSQLFPREELIYLTPHCREEMKHYDHNAIYIVGAIVDKMNQEPLSMAKAKQENIRMLKFPLDKYLLWSGGSGKSLTLNQVISILLDIKHTGDWKYALRHVPSRKIAKLDDPIDKISRNMLRKKAQWTPSSQNLNHLSFNKEKKNFDLDKYKKRKFVSVSSEFRNKLFKY